MKSMWTSTGKNYTKIPRKGNKGPRKKKVFKFKEGHGNGADIPLSIVYQSKKRLRGRWVDISKREKKII